ncbi:hypothetical protein [Iodobacter sp.]|uniref:hypothetical protein n=1 Tax=Iodobacter sp. TaxID=1915058 RepID=UPI0025DF2A06|nr:hypothetical protein [Iodobacter sp.]
MEKIAIGIAGGDSCAQNSGFSGYSSQPSRPNPVNKPKRSRKVKPHIEPEPLASEQEAQKPTRWGLDDLQNEDTRRFLKAFSASRSDSINNATAYVLYEFEQFRAVDQQAIQGNKQALDQGLCDLLIGLEQVTHLVDAVSASMSSEAPLNDRAVASALAGIVGILDKHTRTAGALVDLTI